MTLARDEHATDLVVHEPSQPPQTLGGVDVVFANAGIGATPGWAIEASHRKH